MRPEPIPTERLVIRPFEEADKPALVRGCGRLEIADMLLSVPHPYTMADAEHYLREIVEPGYASGDRYSMAVTLGGELVGACGLNLQKEHERAEMGYWIAVPHWGNGYATEAARAMLGFGFGVLGLNKILATHFPRNPASGRVLQKIGMMREGDLRQHIKKWGRFEDLVMYGVVKADWAKP